MSLLLFLLAALALAGQTQSESPPPSHTTAPRLLHNQEPEYSPEARAQYIQGTVFYQIYINEKGQPEDITVVSPLGFGLDERGAAAIAKWRFAPATKDGKPIRFRATIEMNFHFPEIWYNKQAEHRRTSYNVAAENVKQTDPTLHDPAVKAIRDLAAEGYAPAMYLLGTWQAAGDNVDRNLEDGWKLIQKAADQNYGPALYTVAQRLLEGNPQPADRTQAFKTMQDAAVLGSTSAQYYLGQIYDRGAGVTADASRSRRYFRLCATRGVAQCQARLGTLMLRQPDVPDYDYEQAVAWLQLAADRGVEEARQLASQEVAKLSPAQIKVVNRWKEQLQPR